MAALKKVDRDGLVESLVIERTRNKLGRVSATLALEVPEDLVRHDDMGATRVADALRAKAGLGIEGAILVTNPVPAAHAIAAEDIDALIDEAVISMNRLGITGKATTPYLLAAIAERSGGRSLDTNIELVVNNAAVAADIAVSYQGGAD